MRKVITYGTFDLFHRGHYNILKRAKEEGDYLIVGVTGESYDSERGKLSVQDSLATRIENVKKTGFADQIIVEEYLGQKIYDILKYDVDVLVIGSDWKGKFDHLRKYCEVKYLERTKDISSTQLREENLDIYKFGIVTDDLFDKDAVMEPKNVSGIHVESVFCENKDIAEIFAERYELDKGYDVYDEFLNSVDIVYVKSKSQSRKKYVEEAILKKKHVICDAPIILDAKEDRRLADLAEEMGVILLDNITTLYLQSFGQLTWMARGNLIGDLISIKCSISQKSLSQGEKVDFLDLIYYPVCVFVKIMGTSFKDCHLKAVRDEKGNITYAVLSLIYDNAIASAEIGMDMEVGGGMQILGTNGIISVPDSWWNIGYFKMKNKNDPQFKRYSTNFEGNGFRYLIQSLLLMIKNKTVASQRITKEEADAILSILNKINEDENLQ